MARLYVIDILKFRRIKNRILTPRTNWTSFEAKWNTESTAKREIISVVWLSTLSFNLLTATVVSLLQRFVSMSTAVRGELLFEMIVTHDEQCKVFSPTSRSDAVRGFEMLFRGCRTACNYRVFCTKVVSNYRVCVVCIQFTWTAHT